MHIGTLVPYPGVDIAVGPGVELRVEPVHRADLGDADVLVPDVGDGVVDVLLAEFVCGGQDREDAPVMRREESGGFLLREPVVGEHIVVMGASIPPIR